MGTPQAGAGSMTNDGYRCELCGAWVEYRNLSKVLEHEGLLPHGAQDRPAAGDRTDLERKSRRRVENIGDGLSHGHDTQPARTLWLCGVKKWLGRKLRP